MRELVMIAFLICNPISASVIGGVMWSREYSASMVKDYYERNYARVCPEYKAASTWDRWFDQNFGLIDWCEDYLDRV
ncbi:hypothetical protein CN198_14340 [Sinorhizobium meliloti]|uniref:hypothetical protein n=1 Tax=Rhizobium meliloti TaxID=382 RepID=UPI000FD6E796|nr:hypothetical protein [Sinorhizobium meliloti]RVH69234.1 hypothetical protein CN198_14340 [Sinorhizobium meliloti]